MPQQPDRVTISMGRKIPAEQFGNYEIRVEYSGDVRDAGGVPRIEKVVMAEFERLIKIVEGRKSK